MDKKGKIIEYIIKTNCNTPGYCRYNEENCYDHCSIKLLINEINKVYDEEDDK